jgi:hypothetical protein
MRNEGEEEDGQQALSKWLPLLWIAPVALVLLLALIAYCGR